MSANRLTIRGAILRLARWHTASALASASGISADAIRKYLRGRDMRGEWAAKVLHAMGAMASTPDGRIDLSAGLRVHVVARLSADGAGWVSRVTGRAMGTVSRYMRGVNDMTTAQLQPLVDLARVKIMLPRTGANNVKRVLTRQRYAAKWTNTEISRLKAGDDRLPRKLSRTKASVRAARDRYLQPKKQSRRRGWPESEVALLGTMPDHEVAARCNVTRLTVIRERARRGIAAYKKT